MSISITDDSVIIDGYEGVIDDLYQYAKSINSDVVQKLSNTYLITANVILKNNSFIKALNSNITVMGQLFQIYKGSTLQLGELNRFGKAINGSVLTLPNVLKEYGFGSIVTDDSGNLLAYESMINAYGYWSFFEGTNRVELINTIIDGYGKISGSESIVRNCTFKRVHGKYGIIVYTGSIKEYINLNVDYVEPYVEEDDSSTLGYLINIQDNTDDKNLEIYYGKYSGYSDLLYVMDSAYDYDIILYGTEITGGYNITREDPNKNNFLHKFRFKPKFQDENGMIITNVPVRITNKYGEVEFVGNTNELGIIDTWLTYYKDLAGPTEGVVTTPHKVEVEQEGTILTAYINVENNMEDFPIMIYSAGVYKDKNFRMLSEKLDLLIGSGDTSLKTDINLVAADLRDIILALGSKVGTSSRSITTNKGVTMIIQ
jgi:hypothetical protein